MSRKSKPELDKLYRKALVATRKPRRRAHGLEVEPRHRIRVEKKKVGGHVVYQAYADGEFVGVVETPEHAKRIAEMMFSRKSAHGYTAGGGTAKISGQDFEDLKKFVRDFAHAKNTDLKSMESGYTNRGLSLMRFRWDIFHAAVPQPWKKKVYEYADDRHIDTALRRLFGHKAHGYTPKRKN